MTRVGGGIHTTKAFQEPVLEPIESSLSSPNRSENLLLIQTTDPSMPPLQGYEGFKQLTMLFRSAFPGFHDEIEDILAEGDKVAARWRFRATNSGSFQGMPPTGKAVDVTATGIFRVVDGKVTDNWVNLDALGLMQQLGVIPSMG